MKPDKPKILVQSTAMADVNLEIRKGKLTIIVGETAAGKSSLIGTLADSNAELSGLVRGSIKVRRGGKFVAMAMQEEWVGSGSIKSQILMGRPYQANDYEAAVTSAGLDIDFGTTLDQGDRTQVGDGGTKLSGGQKARVGMARACYSLDTDLYVFDDTLARLDNEVKLKVFEGVFKRRLAGKTRVLVTHDPWLLVQAHDIVVVSRGRIEWSGIDLDKFPERLESGAAKSWILKRMLEVRQETADKLKLKLPKRMKSIAPGDRAEFEKQFSQPTANGPPAHRIYVQSSTRAQSNNELLEEITKTVAAPYTEEHAGGSENQLNEAAFDLVETEEKVEEKGSVGMGKAAVQSDSPNYLLP